MHVADKRPNPYWFIVVIALGFCSYGAYTWLGVDEPDAAELERSVEVNYQVDIARMRATATDGQLDLSDEWEQKHRQAIRDELLSSTQHEKGLARSWFVIGLALLIFSLGRILAQPLFGNKNRD